MWPVKRNLFKGHALCEFFHFLKDSKEFCELINGKAKVAYLSFYSIFFPFLKMEKGWN